MFRVVVVGGGGGIGTAVVAQLALVSVPFTDITIVRRRDPIPNSGDAIVCCNGSFTDPWRDCYERTRDAIAHRSFRINVALSGGGVGGPPPLDVPMEYITAKTAIASMIEWCAKKYSDRQFFAVAPGQTATKLVGFKGADPNVPAAFIVRLLSGKYGHLSGSLLAAQRDNLDEMKPHHLRRAAG